MVQFRQCLQRRAFQRIAPQAQTCVSLPLPDPFATAELPLAVIIPRYSNFGFGHEGTLGKGERVRQEKDTSRAILYFLGTTTRTTNI